MRPGNAGEGAEAFAGRWRSRSLFLVSVPENLVICTLGELTEGSKFHKFPGSFHAPSLFRFYDSWDRYTYFSPGISETLGRGHLLEGGGTQRTVPHSPQGYTFSCLWFQVKL